MSSNILKADNGVSSGTTGLVYTAGNDGTLQLATTTSGGTATTAITIDNSQNVGVGVTPSAWGSAFKAIDIGGNAGSFGGTGGGSYMLFNAYYNASSQYIYKASTYASYYANEQGLHKWYTAPSGTINTAITFTQVMTLDNSGNLLVGTTSQASTSRFTVKAANTTYGGIGVVKSDSSDYWTQNIDSAIGYTFGKNGADFWYAGRSGSANCVSNNGSWVNSSDSRLKTNVVTLTNALENICKLRGVSFNRIANNVSEIGLIAQEVLEVYPDAVEKPTTDDSFYGLNYGSLVGPLIEAIKELSAEVTALKAKIGV